MSTPILLRMSVLERLLLSNMRTKYRWGWPAIFSANAHGDIWPFRTHGYTHLEERVQLRGSKRSISGVALAG